MKDIEVLVKSRHSVRNYLDKKLKKKREKS